MRPLLHPILVNGRFGDPALYIETLFEKRAIMFDLGEISALSPRKIQRLEHIFVSHTHIDHFIGFDHLLRVLVGREKTIRLYGPNGFIEQVQHKLLAHRAVVLLAASPWQSELRRLNKNAAGQERLTGSPRHFRRTWPRAPARSRSP